MRIERQGLQSANAKKRKGKPRERVERRRRTGVRHPVGDFQSVKLFPTLVSPDVNCRLPNPIPPSSCIFASQFTVHTQTRTSEKNSSSSVLTVSLFSKSNTIRPRLSSTSMKKNFVHAGRCLIKFPSLDACSASRPKVCAPRAQPPLLIRWPDPEPCQLRSCLRMGGGWVAALSWGVLRRVGPTQARKTCVPESSRSCGEVVTCNR